MEEIIFEVLKNVLLVFTTALTGYLVSWTRNKIKNETLERLHRETSFKKELAKASVQFVEQVYQEYSSSEKYRRAASWLSYRFYEVGLKYTEDEVHGLIEAVLREFKDQLGEDWAKMMIENSQT